MNMLIMCVCRLRILEMPVEQTKQNLDAEARSLQLIKLHVGKLNTQVEEMNAGEAKSCSTFYPHSESKDRYI
jgi:hypothetical protein